MMRGLEEGRQVVGNSQALTNPCLTTAFCLNQQPVRPEGHQYGLGDVTVRVQRGNGDIGKVCWETIRVIGQCRTACNGDD